jgi:uncharacterized protein (TIGR03067 family)
MMHSLCLCLVTIGLSLADDTSPCPESPDTSATDLKAMQGAWEMTKGVNAGEAMETKGVTMVVEKNTLTVNDGKRDESVTFKLNAKKNPKEIDLVPPKDKGDKLMPGIYKLEKGVLTICFNKEGGTRPMKFDDKGTSLVVFKKVKK